MPPDQRLCIRGCDTRSCYAAWCYTWKVLETSSPPSPSVPWGLLAPRHLAATSPPAPTLAPCTSVPMHACIHTYLHNYFSLWFLSPPAVKRRREGQEGSNLESRTSDGTEPGRPTGLLARLSELPRRRGHCWDWAYVRNDHTSLHASRRTPLYFPANSELCCP